MKGQVVIQERIDQVMAEEFDKLLMDNTDNKLLQLLINDELKDYSIEKLLEYLGGE